MQTLVGFRKYERALIWHEFHYGSEKYNELEERIFREEKTNRPNKYSVPDGLRLLFLKSNQKSRTHVI